MKLSQENTMTEIYNLILNSKTRDWERSLLLEAKDAIETGANYNETIAKLEAALRPLASRNNLTPDVTDFYQKLIGEYQSELEYDSSKHQVTDPRYQSRAVFAGGCFWCMVEPFEERPGIISVLSGYTGGELENPSYDQVLVGNTGHVEAVEIIFDTRIVQYQELIDLYWQITDPTDDFGQFQDRGTQYRPIIFVQDEEQRQIAEAAKQKIIDSGYYKKPIVTEIRWASAFWPAENYHQEFYKKQPKRYKAIKRSRQQFLTYQHLKGNLRKAFTKNN
ncbi:peptide-methionine (S)-S-oxide reductase MsrA [Candidatus Enterococcus ferrettii]|uniref:Peptide methionine sulfoxide reductase MsrA n=1 Tax=Candidatus Enterococcus ferrettii TaxID=2815324 RepID=A0ABV0EKS7_9ENTE|nr:peptide-methionine (S)-S-oxide reductase MsrA [Enterococcus sp. 665A]MBO1340683.1 peptide-methionine (S)-S-oxide reductase MsrA [Enterococcus sp. 665A]